MARKYIYGPGMDNPVAMVHVDGQNETWYYYFADALGSIRLLVHESGAIAESYAYDVYGRPRVMAGAGPDGNWLTEDTATQDASAVGNPYLFTARRWDAATGLYHYRFRDYSPALGRFLQPDPLGYIDGMNLYQYCGNNPINWIDPWGLCRQGSGTQFDSGLSTIAEEVAGEVVQEVSKKTIPSSKGVIQKIPSLPKGTVVAEWYLFGEGCQETSITQWMSSVCPVCRTANIVHFTKCCERCGYHPIMKNNRIDKEHENAYQYWHRKGNIWPDFLH